MQTSYHKKNLISQQKQKGLYQNEVTSSLTAIQRPEVTEQTTEKWSIPFYTVPWKLNWNPAVYLIELPESPSQWHIPI